MTYSTRRRLYLLAFLVGGLITGFAEAALVIGVIALVLSYLW